MAAREDLEGAHFDLQDDIMKLMTKIDGYLTLTGMENRYLDLFRALENVKASDAAIIGWVETDIKNEREAALQGRAEMRRDELAEF